MTKLKRKVALSPKHRGAIGFDLANLNLEVHSISFKIKKILYFYGIKKKTVVVFHIFCA